VSNEILKRLAAGRQELAAWQEPTHFVAKVEELAAPVKSESLFNNAAAGFLLDAMVLAEFTKFRSTERVRLVDQREQWPDGQIGTPHKPVNVEVTEVLEEGRRRGDEYRKDGQPESGTAEDWRERAQAIPGQLEKAIQRKVGKGYAKNCVLLVYVNMSNFGILQEETEAAIAKVKAKYADSFQEICVLWQVKLL
jgi:hypothetical protein